MGVSNPAMGTRFLLLRHGLIEANRKRRWHGSTDSPLTWHGRRQARRTGKHLRTREKIDAVYSSPLQRCQQTARLATRGMPLEVQTLDGLAEMHIGEWEDMSFRDLVREHDFINRATLDPSFAPPDGESVEQVAARVLDALHHIDAQHDGEHTVLVVSHGVAFSIALSMFLHNETSRWMEYQVDNCSLTEFRLRPEPTVHAFNQNAHL